MSKAREDSIVSKIRAMCPATDKQGNKVRVSSRGGIITITSFDSDLVGEIRKKFTVGGRSLFSEPEIRGTQWNWDYIIRAEAEEVGQFLAGTLEQNRGLSTKVRENAIICLDRQVAGVFNPTLRFVMDRVQGSKWTSEGDTSFSGSKPSMGRSLGFSFTITHPERLRQRGEFVLDTSDLASTIADKMRRDGAEGVDEVAIRSVLDKLDVAGLISEALVDYRHADSDLGRDQEEYLSSLVERDLSQSTEAYSEDGPVELAEYPKVYVDFRFSDTGYKFRVTQSGSDKYTVMYENRWEVRPSRWSFG